MVGGFQARNGALENVNISAVWRKLCGECMSTERYAFMQQSCSIFG